MDLLIATEQNSSFIVAAGEAAFSFKIVKRPYSQSELLLKTIDSLLDKENKGRRKRKIKKIFAVAGPGQFSSVRIGVATANALAFGWGVPVFGLRAKKGWDLLTLKQKLLEMREQTKKTGLREKKSRFVLPIYCGEPRITK